MRSLSLLLSSYCVVAEVDMCFGEDRQQAAVKFQLFQDALDILSPAGTLGYHNLDDGILGITG